MQSLFARIRRFFTLLIFWRKPEPIAEPARPEGPAIAGATGESEEARPTTVDGAVGTASTLSRAGDVHVKESEDIASFTSAPAQATPAPTVIKHAARRHREKDIWAAGYEPKHKPRDPDAPPRDPDAPPKPKRERTVLHVKDEEVEEDSRDPHWHFDRASVEEAGTFYFRGALLNDLDVYFQVMARMKLGHRDAYDFYSKVGGAIIPQSAAVFVAELSPFWKDPKTRPGFAAASFALRMEDVTEDADDSKNVFYPRFEFVNKMEIPPTHVEPTHDDVYEVISYFDHRKQRRDTPKWIRKHGFMICFHVAVDKHGNVRSLKHLQTKYIHIPRRTKYIDSHGRKRKIPNDRQGGNTFSQQLWDYPPMLVDWFNDHKHHFPTTMTADGFGARQFNLIANLGNSDESGVRIEITEKAGNTACFAVDMKRVAYFFKDRDIVLTPKGTRARIFHVVRPHVRTLKSGKEVAYRMHFRGLRSFQWAGYQVHITVPGLHHEPVFNLGLAVSDHDAMVALGHRPSHLTMAKFGDAIRHIVHGEQKQAAAIMREKRPK